MLNITVRPIEEDRFGAWDALVAASPDATVFHRSEWITLMGRVQKRRPVIYGCFDQDDDLHAGLVTYQYRKRGVRMATSAILMSPFGGVIIANPPGSTGKASESRERKVCRAIIDALEREPLDFIVLEQSPGFRDIRSFLWCGWQSSVGYTFVLPLDSINPSGEARRYIRRAIESGIVVERVTDIDRYWHLFEQMFQRQSVRPPLDREQVRSIFATISAQDMGEMWAAIAPSGEWAVAEILLRDERCYYSWSAASDRDLLNTGANFLLNNTLFEYERAAGYSRSCLFSANMSNLSKVMSQFKPELHPYYRVMRRQGRLGFFNRLPNRLA